MELNYILVYITVPSQEIGLKIANMLTKEKLAACVNIVPGISSIYSWQGVVEQDEELLLIIKTKNNHFDRLAIAVKKIHPYKVPEIIAVPIIGGSSEYLAWIDTETRI